MGILKILFLYVLTFLLIVSMAGCGGGLSNLTFGDNTSEDVSLVDNVLTGSLDGVDIARAVLGCKIGNVMDDVCSFSHVEVFYPLIGTSISYPLGISLKNKETVSVDIPVFDQALKTTEPFLYLRDDNPSTAFTEWTVKTAVISRVQTSVVGYGYENCKTEIQPSPDPSEPGTPVTVCTPGEKFSGSIMANEVGTVAIYGDGSKKLEETMFGLLSGTGSGTISRTNYNNRAFLDFSITGGVVKNSPVVATYMTPLSTFSIKGKAVLTYGDLVLTLDNGLFKDTSGTLYGQYIPSTGKIDWFSPIGSRGSVIVLSYESDPFTGMGGEIVGYGNGVDTIYTVKTKYPFVVKDSLRAFSSQGEGEILLVSPDEGLVTVRFKSPVATNEPIKLSYKTYKVTMPVELVFYTSRGSYKKQLTYTLEID